MGVWASSVRIALSTHQDGRRRECLSCPAVSRSNGSGYKLQNATFGGYRNVGGHGVVTKILPVQRPDWAPQPAAGLLAHHDRTNHHDDRTQGCPQYLACLILQSKNNDWRHYSGTLEGVILSRGPLVLQEPSRITSCLLCKRMLPFYKLLGLVFMVRHKTR